MSDSVISASILSLAAVSCWMSHGKANRNCEVYADVGCDVATASVLAFASAFTCVMAWMMSVFAAYVWGEAAKGYFGTG